MRLEDRHDAALERRARRGERRLHFLGMMRVVVETIRPAASPLISKRRLMPENFASARAATSKVIPNSSATAIAASEFIAT